MKTIVATFLILAAVLQVSLTSGDVESKFVTLNGARYYVSVQGEVAKPDEAATICGDMGMTLINLETQTEYEVVHQFLLDNIPSARTFWTSGRLVNDVWTWTGSGLPFDYVLWAPNEPNERDPTQAQVYINGFVHGLGDTNTDTAANFICE